MEEGICKDSTERRGGSGDMRSGCKVSNWKKNHEKKNPSHCFKKVCFKFCVGLESPLSSAHETWLLERDFTPPAAR